MRTVAENLQLLWHQARKHLEDATTVPTATALSGYSLRCRLWRETEFSECRSWSLFTPKSSEAAKAYYVRRVIWHEETDSERLLVVKDSTLDKPVGSPTLSYTDATLEASQVASVIADGMTIWMPVVGQDSGVWREDVRYSDERGYEEEAGRLRFTWNGPGPEPWRDFIAWAEAFMAFLDRACDVQQKVSFNEHSARLIDNSGPKKGPASNGT